MRTVEDLWRLELEQLGRERELSDPDPDLWRWSPLELPEFARMLDVARNLAALENKRRGEALRRLTMAEAGSGIGTKLYLAEKYYDIAAVGYEVSEEYIAAARELGVTTVHADLRQLPASEWVPGKNIVYISRPFKDDAVESEWEHSVHEAMDDRAVLIAAYAAVKPYAWPCYYRAPFRGVWIKQEKESWYQRGGTYGNMITRATTGSDPLVQEPSTAQR